MSDSDSDSESNVPVKQRPPSTKNPVRRVKCSLKLEEGNDPSLLPYPGVGDYKKQFRSFSTSRVWLPSPWFRKKISIHDCKAYQPYNKHIYQIAIGAVPCDLQHIVPESYDPKTSSSTHHMPCGCEDVACYTPPANLYLDITSSDDISSSFLNPSNVASTTAWVWDTATQFSKTRDLSYVLGTCVFPVPCRSTVFRGTRKKKRKKGLQLSDRKYQWKKRFTCPKKINK